MTKIASGLDRRHLTAGCLRAADPCLIIPLHDDGKNPTLSVYKFVNRLLQFGYEIDWAQTPFLTSVDGKKRRKFPAGSFVVPLGLRMNGYNSRRFLIQLTDQIADELCLRTYHLTARTFLEARRLREPRVAIYSDAGADPTAFSVCLEKLGFTIVHFLTRREIASGSLGGHDALIIPGGDSSTIVAALDTEGCRRIREFVRTGGTYVGACAGAFIPSQRGKLDRPLGPQAKEFQEPHRHIELISFDILNNFYRDKVDFPAWTFMDHGDIVRVFPFSGELSSSVRVRVLKPNHPIMFGYSGLIDIHMAGPVMQTGSGVNTLAVFDSPSPRTEYGLPAKEAWKIARGKAAIISARCGKGNVILFGPHPEEYYEHTHPMIGNALLFAASDASRQIGVPSSQQALGGAPPIWEKKELTSGAGRAVSEVINTQRALREKAMTLFSKFTAIKDTQSDLVPVRILGWFLYSLGPAIQFAEAKFDELRTLLVELLQAHSSTSFLEEQLRAYKSQHVGKDEFHAEQSLRRLQLTRNSIEAAVATCSHVLPRLQARLTSAEEALAEVQSLLEQTRTMKSEAQETSELRNRIGVEIMLVIAQFTGGEHLLVPWYDGKFSFINRPDIKAGQRGIVGILMETLCSLRRSKFLYRHTYTFVSN